MASHFVGEYADGPGKGELWTYKSNEVCKGRLVPGETVVARPELGSEQNLIVRFRSTFSRCNEYIRNALSIDRPTKTVLVVPPSARSRDRRVKEELENDQEAQIDLATVPRFLKSRDGSSTRRSVSFREFPRIKDEPMDMEEMEHEEGMEQGSTAGKRSTNHRGRRSSQSPFYSSMETAKYGNRNVDYDYDPNISQRKDKPRLTLTQTKRKSRKGSTPTSTGRRVSTPTSTISTSPFSHPSSFFSLPSSLHSTTQCKNCRRERRKRKQLERKLEEVQNSLRNIERYVEFITINTNARPVTRYRGEEFLDRDEVAELSRSTPNDATFLRHIIDAIFYKHPDNSKPSSERDKNRILFAKDIFFTLRCDSEEEARKKWNELIWSYDDNVIRRRNSSTTWHESKPKLCLINMQKKEKKKKRAFISSDDDSSEDEI